MASLEMTMVSLTMSMKASLRVRMASLEMSMKISLSLPLMNKVQGFSLALMVLSPGMQPEMILIQMSLKKEQQGIEG